MSVSTFASKKDYGMVDNDSVKKIILKIRESLGLSQEDMAALLGISRNTYRNIEKGQTKLISDTVGKIAEVAKLSPEEVVLGYMPVKDKSEALRDARDRMNEKVQAIQAELGGQLEVLRTENEMLKRLLAATEESNKTKDSMIAMLQKQLNTDKK